MKILCFGSLNIDNVYSVPHFVRPGETMDSLDFHRFCGGKGLNQSIAAARAGGQVWHAGCVGADGGMLLDALAAAGVNTELVSRTDTPTGHAVIQVNEAGQNCILLFGGANRRVTGEQIEAVLSRFGAGDFLILQNEINALPEIIAAAKARGMRIFLNPSPMSEEILRLPLRSIDCFLLNELEARELCGTDAEEEACLSLLRERFPDSAVVLTRGSRGCLYADAQRRLSVPAFPVHAVDTTGAGDTFTGFLIAALAAGQPAEDALRLASCAAAISVTRPGASSSVPTLREVLASGMLTN